MSQKSVIAARFSIEALVEQSPKVYLWTFTFKDCLYPVEAMRRWNLFSNQIKRKYPTVGGVRVTEWHPGQDFGGDVGFLSHGLHIHLITNERLDVDILNKLKGELFGRIHVIECKDRSDIGRLSGYLAKYLSKGYRFRHPLLKGARLWANWANWRGTKVKEVESRNGFSIWFKELKALLEGWGVRGDEKCVFDQIFCEYPPAEDVKYAFFALNNEPKKDKIKGARFRFYQASKLLYSQLRWEHQEAWQSFFGTMHLTR